ncbi:hypothetical protein N8692_04990, partial [Flavobacteriales bacterium]|nr:hypothetical protein [Flavobacteriales bacterium]
YTFFINGVQNSIPPPGDSIFSSLSEGTYIITVADSDSCGLVETITIEAPQFPLQVLSSNSVIICDNNSNGSAIGLAAGGSPYSDGHYNFDWYTANGGFFGDLVGSGDSISILSLGDYFLQVTDSNGCQANIPINVSPQQLPVIISPNLFEIVCKGDSSGSAIAFAGGGTAPYDYVWSVQNGDTIEVVNDISISDTLFGLTSGTYDLVVTDSDGCTDEMTYFFNEPNIALEIESVEVVDSIDCFGDLDGRALVSMVSGSGELPYSYLWDNGEATFLANSLSGGWHTITVTDARGCVVVDSVLIPENPIIKSTLDITNPVSCYGYNDAEITVITFGGVQTSNYPYYEYNWSNGYLDTTSITGLFFGSYSLITRDALGCVVIDSIFLPEPSPLYVNAEEVLEVSCYGDSTGTATVYGVGGTLPYTFEWQNNNIVSSPLDSSATETTLFYGEETVSLEDDRGCIATDTVMINQPEPLVVTISDSTLAYCVGVNTASATASVVGGTVPYTYVWDDNSVVPQTTAIASNLDYGFYSVVVTDHRGCTASVSVDLEDYEAPLSVSIDVVSTISCYGDSDGELAVSTNGTGTAPFTYQWFGPSGSNSNATISNLSEGLYSVTVVDANGCTENTFNDLEVPDPLLYKVVSSVDAECLGACDGEMELYIEGGKVPYFAELVDNQSGISSIFDVEASDSSTVLNVCTGDYTVLVTDDNGCDGSVILGGSNQMTLDITISTDVTANIDQLVVCYGDSTGVISVTSPNQDTSYTYMWTNLNGDTLSYSSEIDSLFIGDYILYSGYNGIEGCTTVDTISLIQNALIYSSAVITNVSCYGGNDGIIALVTSGGTGPYEYSWSQLPFSGDTVPGLFAGSYNVTITDTSSCSQTQTYNVTEPTLLTASVTSSQTYILNTTATGGTSPYFYSWIEQSQPGVELGASDSYVVGAAGIYYVVVTDDNGCESQSNSTTFVQTGILDVASLEDLSIYPNPFRNETTVDFGRVVEDAKITVVDIYGKVIEKYEINDTDKYIIKRATKAS